jgi:hypothetical protein
MASGHLAGPDLNVARGMIRTGALGRPPARARTPRALGHVGAGVLGLAPARYRRGFPQVTTEKFGRSRRHTDCLA